MKWLKIGIILTVLWHGGSRGAAAQISADAALSKFVSGGIAYKSGEYEKAVKHYEEVLTGNFESGPLYYNLANSYYKLGDHARAILNYERARRIMPRDSDLNFNYAYVKKMTRQNGFALKGNVWRRTWERIFKMFTVNEMVRVVAFCALGVAVLYLLCLYLNLFSLLSRTAMIFLASVMMIFFIGIPVKVQAQKDLAVILKQGESYFEPLENSTVHFKLIAGMQIKIIKTEGNWVKVIRLDGKVGWVLREMVEEI